jgi:hypothetical protein
MRAGSRRKLDGGRFSYWILVLKDGFCRTIGLVLAGIQVSYLYH